jgi:hypothetical protein
MTGIPVRSAASTTATDAIILGDLPPGRPVRGQLVETFTVV